MRKVLLIIGIFGVLSVGMFISGCEDYKNCSCTRTTYDDSNNVTSTETFEDTVPEDKNCDSLNGHNSENNIYIVCVGNH